MFRRWLNIWERLHFPPEARGEPHVVAEVAQLYGKVFHADGRLVLLRGNLCFYRQRAWCFGWPGAELAIPVSEIVALEAVDELHGWATFPLGDTARVVLSNGDMWEFGLESRAALEKALKAAGVRLREAPVG